MTKHVLSLLLALTTLLSLGVPAFAAGSGEAASGEPAPAGAVEKSAPAPAQAAGTVASGTCGAEGSNVTWKLTDDGVLTISGIGAMDDWNHNGGPWSGYLPDITSVKILSGVTSIGECAFTFCESLTSVTIPSGVTSIGEWAFAYCTSLASAKIPSSVTSIGEGAFNGCKSLTSVTIPGSVTSIVDSAFAWCSSLTSVTIPAGVTSIGNWAFENCTSLKSVTIPGSVTSIGDCAFSGCDSLTSVTIPSSVTSIGDSVFESCTSLTSVTIPASVTSIGRSAFSYCKSLASVTIPGSVTSIGDWAFELCTSLKSVTIPASVTDIGYGAFGVCCYSLTAITVDGGNKNYCSEGGVLFNKAKTELIQYPGGKSGAYSIPSGVTSIGAYAFYYCDNLTSVTIPAGVTSIGAYAFEDCTSLKSVTIPGSVTSIGDWAFGSCYWLQSVTISSGVTSIGSCAFKYCTNLTSVTIPASVTSIKENAFANCSSDLVIYGKKGSYAETYAKENGIKFSTETAPKYALSAPKLSKVENVNGGVKVTWGKVTGAEKYRVFYKPSGGSWAKAGDTTATSYTWTGAKSGTTYQFRVWCISADGKKATSTYDTIKTITYIAAPNYTLSTPTTGGIKLSWSKVAGASKYKVFYKTTGDWKTLTTTTGTSCTIKSPKAGTKYTFRVRCVNSAGAVISGYITDKTLTYQAPAKPSQLPAPKLSKVENVNGGVKVTWGKVTGAEKYRVFYKPSGGSWAKAGDTTSTSYTWTGAKSGTSYQFRVWCVSADGKTQTSTYDGVKSITYVAAPNYTLSTPTTGGIKLSWSKVTGASKYRIYYKTTGDWKTLTTTAGTSYTVKSPKAGTKYTFRVRCVNSTGAVISGYITDKTLTYQAPAKPSQLPAPKLSSVENVNGGVRVTWSKVTGAEKYRVFYKPSGGSWAKAGDTTSTSYTWKGAKSGTSYQFRVWCISADGKKATSTYDAIKTITYVAAPNYTLSTSTTGGIKLSWSKVAGASKYTVFYKTTGDWKTLTTTTGTSCTIKSPKAGTKYTFRVRCVNSAGSVVSGYITDKTLTYMK